MVKKCMMCGEPFIPTNNKQRMCSPQCIARYNDSTYKFLPITRTCDECGSEFSTCGDLRFCSNECREKALARDREERRLKEGKVSNLDEVLRYCKKVGITYAEYQKRKTMIKVRGKKNEHESD